MPEITVEKLARLETLSDRAEAAAEILQIEVQQLLYSLMKTKKVSQKEIAEKLGVSTALVSRTFSTYQNLTLRQAARFAAALGEEFAVGLKSKAARRIDYKLELAATTTTSQKAFDIRATRRAMGADVVGQAPDEPRSACEESMVG